MVSHGAERESRWSGASFGHKYRIDGVLGQGGMGTVLAGWHVALDQPVAIKVLRPEVMRLPGMVERFVREARAVSRIASEHVVRVRDADRLASGVPYIVMERLEGTDLAQVCRQTKAVAVEVAVGFVLEACEAISEAHALGIVHRDLKPGNLFLARRHDGSTRIKVLDFGVSKVALCEGDCHVTAAGTALGSPSYMSPEQMRSSCEVDGRTDIWALGAILYRLVAGVPPFRAGSTAELCALVLDAAPTTPSLLRRGLCPGLEAVILRCLEKDRSRRFRTAAELAAALRPFAAPNPARVLQGRSTGALPASQAPSAFAWSRGGTDDSEKTTQPLVRGRRPGKSALAAVIAAGLVLGLAVAVESLLPRPEVGLATMRVAPGYGTSTPAASTPAASAPSTTSSMKAPATVAQRMPASHALDAALPLAPGPAPEPPSPVLPTPTPTPAAAVLPTPTPAAAVLPTATLTPAATRPPPRAPAPARSPFSPWRAAPPAPRGGIRNPFR